jgi:hypothetical protein
MSAQNRFTWNSLLQVGKAAITYWRIYIIWIAAMLIPTAVLSVPIGKLLAAQLDHSVYALTWAREFKMPVLFEAIMNTQQAMPALLGAALISGLLTLLFWPFLTAMVVAAAREDRWRSFVALIQGGIRDYGRMLRMLIWSVIPLGIAAAIGGSVLHWVSKRAESAILESHVMREQRLGLLLLLLLLMAAHVTIEAGRAQFALDATRRSAVKAWWRGLRLVLARPLAAFGSYLLITAVAVLVMALLAILRINLPHISASGFVLGFIVTQLISIEAIWMRTARLLTLTQLTKTSSAA